MTELADIVVPSAEEVLLPTVPAESALGASPRSAVGLTAMLVVGLAAEGSGVNAAEDGG